MASTVSFSDQAQSAVPRSSFYDSLAIPPPSLQTKGRSSCCSGPSGCSGKATPSTAAPVSSTASVRNEASGQLVRNPFPASSNLCTPSATFSVPQLVPNLGRQQAPGSQRNRPLPFPRTLQTPIQTQFSLPTLQRMAIGISVASIFYNGAEGGISIGFGKEDQSKALIFFGIQSFVEVASASLVVWRFAKIALPGEEQVGTPSPASLRKEKVATVAIGGLLGLLTVSAWGVSIQSLIRHERPTVTLPGLIIAASALGLMIAIWAPKPWLAKSLDSSAMRGEAKCSLACISMTAALLTGTVINRAWSGGWWVDSATTLVLSLFFAKDAVEMVRWGLSKDFSGSCCRTCAPADQGPVQPIAMAV